MNALDFRKLPFIYLNLTFTSPQGHLSARLIMFCDLNRAKKKLIQFVDDLFRDET